MLIPPSFYRRFLFIVCLALTFSCSTAKKVSFKIPVDTTSKRIILQNKKVVELNDMQLFLSNDFDGARLNDVKKINDSTIKIIVRPENIPINNSAYYAFKIWSKTNRIVYLDFDYPSGYKHRYIPKLKKENSNWYILNESNITKNNDNVTVKLDISPDTLTVAAQEIVTSKSTYSWYENIIENKDYVKSEIAGYSNLGKKLPVLDIYKGEKKNKPIIVLLTRQHPPEVTGFFAFKEFLKTILIDNELSSKFLNKYRVLAFPILNPDGVDLGHWRHNANGVDLNRDWSKYNQQEIKQVVKYITRASKQDKGRIILGLDFHSTYEDVFYTNTTREGTTLPSFVKDWFSSLEANIENYKVNEKASNSTRPVSKGWFLYGQNAVGITYEIGDATPKNKIQLIGRVSAEQMMQILTKE